MIKVNYVFSCILTPESSMIALNCPQLWKGLMSMLLLHVIHALSVHTFLHFFEFVPDKHTNSSTRAIMPASKMCRTMTVWFL